jgi:hypothetical protein
MKISITAVALAVGIGVAAAGGGCGNSNSDSGFDAGSGGSGSGGLHDGSTELTDSGAPIYGDSGYGSLPDSTVGPPPPDGGVGCTNLQCNIASCGDGGATTTITGKVLDPAGHNPLYNVVVFIPNTQGGVLPPIPQGLNSASCSCAELFAGEEPVVDTLTLADGTFTLKNVPSGTNIPLVVQVGKWRKEIVIPSVAPCTSTAIPGGTVSLPKNASDGMYASLPNIAVSTGYADTLECLLTRIGVSETEFTGQPASPQHVHVFQGGSAVLSGYNTNPGGPKSAAGLWDKDSDIEQYDIVMLSCEGEPTTGATAASSQVVADYVNYGGRVFAEHYHYQFFYNAPTIFPNLATWDPGEGNTYTPPINATIQTTLPNGMPFQEGTALEAWLTNVGALTNNELSIAVPRGDALVGPTNAATPWAVTATGVSPQTTQYFSWDMPFNAPKDDAGVPEYCGRVVFSDLHVSGGDGTGTSEDYTAALGTTVPTGCDATATLSPDEDALEFILFDLSSCVTPIGYPPKPPPAGPEAGIQ